MQLNLFSETETRANSPPEVLRFVIEVKGGKYSCLAECGRCTDVFVSGFCVEKINWQFGFFVKLNCDLSRISRLLELKEITRARLSRLIER